MGARLREIVYEDGEIGDFVPVDPQDFQVGQVWKPGVRVKLVGI